MLPRAVHVANDFRRLPNSSRVARVELVRPFKVHFGTLMGLKCRKVALALFYRVPPRYVNTSA